MTTDATPATLPKPIIGLSCVFGLSWKNVTIYCETLKDAEEVSDWLCEGPILTAQVEALTAERDALREALADVINPFAYLQRKAKAEGRQLSGQAYAIANDLQFVKSIARSALASTREGDVATLS